jgi:glycosyltransferase involved in cell wall biosynthesis
MAPLASLDTCRNGTGSEAWVAEAMQTTGRASLGILIAGNFLSRAGGNRGVCEDLAERLGALGWPVVTTSSRTGRLARVADILHTAWSRRRDYEVAQIDLFSGPAFFWALALGWLLERLAKPYILTLHGGNMPDFSSRWPRLTGWLLRHAAAVTAPSGYLANALHGFRSDIEILPNAIDLDSYPFRWRKHAAARLVWLRAFHDIYDPQLAIRTVALLTPQFPEIRLLMAGPDKRDGSYQATRALAHSLGVDAHVEYAGRIPKSAVAAAIDRGDIFLNTSKIDNHPVTLLEAMACGACVVTTSPGGVPYMAQDGVNCLSAPVGDATRLAAAIRELLTRPELAVRVSRQARAGVEACDWPAVLARWRSLLSSAAKKSSYTEKGIHI